MPAVYLDVLGGANTNASEQTECATAAATPRGGASGRPAAALGRLGRRRLRQLHAREHVGALVLDRLEGADRPAELPSLAGVGSAGVEAGLRPAHLLGRQRGRGQVEHVFHDVRCAAVAPDQCGGRAGEVEPGHLARGVERAQRCPGEPHRVGVHGEQARPRGCPRDHQQQVRRRAIDDQRLLSGQRPSAVDRSAVVAMSSSAHDPSPSATANGGGRLAGGDRREVALPARCRRPSAPGRTPP